jgi:hypothetical protein
MVILAAHTLCVNARTVFSPGWLAIGADGCVREVSGTAIVPIAGEEVVEAGLVVPGFVDIHSHGKLHSFEERAMQWWSGRVRLVGGGGEGLYATLCASLRIPQTLLTCPRPPSGALADTGVARL